MALKNLRMMPTDHPVLQHDMTVWMPTNQRLFPAYAILRPGNSAFNDFQYGHTITPSTTRDMLRVHCVLLGTESPALHG